MSKLENLKVGSQKEKDFEIIEARFTYLDMEDKKRDFCIDLAKQAYKKKYDLELKYYRDMAKFMKEELDKKFEGSWHIIIGTHFGSFCTYEVK
mmetsp:Transcript_30168/g.29660  ORF Transcript_30168/g.29660 Transcript_30168/m.29660 type:complete len:93 (-) Transcript_30168:104-382(-)